MANDKYDKLERALHQEFGRIGRTARELEEGIDALWTQQFLAELDDQRKIVQQVQRTAARYGLTRRYDHSNLGLRLRVKTYLF